MNKPNLDDPDLSLADLMTHWPRTIPIFIRHRMLCVGCPISRFHTVANACAEYHLNEKDFLEELKQAIDVK